MSSPRLVVATVTAALLVLAGGALAHAQAYMTPAGAPQAVESDAPHRLRGNPIFGGAFELGTFHGDDTTAVALDGWFGFGVSDRLAVLAFGQFQFSGLDESHIAFGGGVRGWPIALAPRLSLEGRAGIAFRSWEPSATDGAFVNDSGLTLGGSAIVDLVRRPMLGVELRGSVSAIRVGDRDDVTALIGLGASLY